MKKQYSIERINELINELETFNLEDINNIELTKDGKVIPISAETLKDWKFVGMTNVAFVELEFWKGNK